MTPRIDPSTDENLKKIWDSTYNGNITLWRFGHPRVSMPQWICEKEPHHRYRLKMYDAKAGRRCTICAGKTICQVDWCNSVWSNANLRAEWVPSNGDMKTFTIKSHAKVDWCCATCRENWRAAITDRTRGSGCPYCAGRRVGAANSISVSHPQLAREWDEHKNGPISVTPGSHKKVWWRCGAVPHHSWQAVVNNRTKGAGCPICASQLVCSVDACNTLGALHPELKDEWSAANSFSIFSILPRTSTPIEWVCSVGHTWTATSHSRLSNKTGCPSCKRKSEHCAREAFEELLPGHKFPTIRPSFLNGLELDGYCSDIALAFEYDGAQHERFTSFFHKTQADFDSQVARDTLKNQLCAAKGVHLIRIPSTFTFVDPKAMKVYIEAAINAWISSMSN